MLDPRGDHPLLEIWRGLAGHRMRSRRPIPQTCLALGIETANPLVSALTADPHCLGDMSNRHALIANTLNKQTTPPKREPGITVRHEDILECEDGYLHTARRSSHVQGPVTNVSAEYI